MKTQTKETKKNTTPTALVNSISGCYHDAIRLSNEKAGVPAGYRALLFHLAQGDGKTQYELSRLTGLKAPTVSIALQKMEAAGYVERKTDKYDLRVSRVYLTEKGTKIEKDNSSVAESFEKKSMAGFSKEERETLCALLTKMKNNVAPEDESEKEKDE